MKKIMFSDKYCLTKAVLDGAKTMTRRLLRDNVPLGNWEETAKYLPYKVGRVVAIAQSYNDIYNELEEQGDDVSNDWWIPSFEGKVLDTLAGYKNKMFVRSDLMLHHIKITDVKVERLQDISDDDILREGIRKESYAGGCMYFYNKAYIRKGNRYVEPIYNTTPMRAFASLIYKVCGGETWESNPWVVAYSFELVD
jgi:hypothetical protein bacD2_23304|nr:MAG TPA: ASCH domain protein [Caudoviricetes sp.]